MTMTLAHDLVVTMVPLHAKNNELPDGLWHFIYCSLCAGQYTSQYDLVDASICHNKELCRKKIKA